MAWNNPDNFAIVEVPLVSPRNCVMVFTVFFLQLIVRCCRVQSRKCLCYKYLVKSEVTLQMSVAAG